MATMRPRFRAPRAILDDPRAGRMLPAASVALVLALVLVIILDPGRSAVQASSVFGGLRAAGEPAFIAGHRGDRAGAPENTLPALQAALDSSMDFVETDLQLSADGVPVLIHDVTVDRTTDGSGAVADHTLAQLQALDAGSWYSTDFADARVPTFAAFLEILAESDKKALLELKGFWTADEVRLVTDLVHDYWVQDRVTFASVDFTTLDNIGEVGPGFGRAIICRDLPKDPVGLATHFGAIAIITTPRSLEENPDAVEEMHRAGLGLIVYTLNSERRWSDAVALGVDGIVTDRPSLLDEWLAETAPET